MCSAVAHRIAHAGFGFTPAASRTVTSVPRGLLALVPKPSGITMRVKENEQVERDTIPLIKKVVRETLSQTSALAKKLKGRSLEETLRNDTNFILKHIRYKRDAAGKEQVREPARLIHEGAGDCDCFATLLSSLLTNQKIGHALRIMKQHGAGNWSHIYVVVPKPGGGHYTLDPVTNSFNVEPPSTQKKDIPMALERLSGVAETEAEKNPLWCKLKRLNALEIFVPTKQVLDSDLVPTRNYLIDKKIPFVEDGDRVIVKTPEGNISVPSILTPDQAKAVDVVATVPAEEIKAATPEIKQQQAGFGWLMGLLLGGALLSSLSSPKKAATKVASGGLAGTTKRKAKAKRKYKTIHL